MSESTKSTKQTATASTQPSESKSQTQTTTTFMGQSDQPWSDKIFYACLFIGGGIVLLLINLDILPWPHWRFLWPLWPILLIGVGLSLLLERSHKGRWISNILWLALIICALGYAMIMTRPQLYQNLRQAVPALPYVEELDPELEGQVNQQIIEDEWSDQDLSQRRIKVDMSTGRLKIDPTQSDRQIELRSQGQSDQSSTQTKTEFRDGQLDITVDINKGRSQPFGFLNPNQAARQYQLRIGQVTIPTELNIDLGAGITDLDFSQPFSLTGGTWEVGTGQLSATFGPDSLPQQTLTLDIGVGSMTITLPSSVAVKVKHDVGIGNMKVFGQSIEREGEYTSDDYHQAEQKINLVAEVGVGELIIKHPD